ncbi:uncharacterized protein LOC110037741 [Phalaenopsis equestris]|uniref:uncharacterized protein LOC110037741 n=1 Tax=Phalaenopsis equestris TaxID=78828 RepID=UPI0009E47031|nr:uncharacterized protein LOC110037741 [Phalaenopsis equestris]
MLAAATLALRPCGSLPSHGSERPLTPKGNPPIHLADLHLLTIGKGFGKLGGLCIRNSSFPIRAVAVGSDELGFSQTIDEVKPKRYHFLVANAKFMLDEEEHFKELLFEKRRNYGERNKEQDFWLVIEPKFLDQFPNITNRLKRPAVALVSTDDRWITFMKLRLDRVLSGNYEANSLEEALICNSVDLQFEKTEKWVAPYPKYEFGWWEPFLLPKSNKNGA